MGNRVAWARRSADGWRHHARLESAVLVDKDDYNQIGFRFRARGDYESDQTADLAERTMAKLRQDFIRIRRPDWSALEKTLARLTEVYAAAYGSAAESPPVAFDGTWQMREYVRSWITWWDLHRLVPGYEARPVISPIAVDYSEDLVLEQSPAEDDE